MKKPDIKVVEALCVLQSQSPDAYLVIQQWFMDSSSAQDTLMRQAEQPHILYRAQGGSKELLEVCETLASPQDLLAKMSMKRAGVTPLP